MGLNTHVQALYLKFDIADQVDLVNIGRGQWRGDLQKGGRITPTANVTFISHANPEDNEFTSWIALQLARSGYLVWTDITKLIGGEDFWSEAETAVREGAIKFLYVLSRTSNRKPGPLQELQVAISTARSKGIKDFIVPLLIDDLPFSEFNIQLVRLNAISFQHNWAEGLARLLSKFEKDGVPKSIDDSSRYVSHWWNRRYGSTRSIKRRRENHLLNVTRVLSMPKQLWRHTLASRTDNLAVELAALPFPAFHDKGAIVSFAPADDILGITGTRIAIVESTEIDLPNFTAFGHSLLKEREFITRNHCTRLMEDAWRKFIASRQLPHYDFAEKTCCFYFNRELISDENVAFTRPDGSKSRRAVVGYKTMSKTNRGDLRRWWQFGISLKPVYYPFHGYYIRPHVLFSDNGSDVWEEKDRLHSARRSQCKGWWNDDWRDRIIAALTFLSVDGLIKLPLSISYSLTLSRDLVGIESPVSYKGESVNDESMLAEFEEDPESDFEDDEEDTGGEGVD